MSNDMSKHKPHIRRLDAFTNEPVLDHEYDGIEELDNPLPGWWLATFYICIAFAGVYFTWQNILAWGQVHEQAYRAERAAIEARSAAAEAAKIKAIDPVAFNQELSDKGLAAAGAQVFGSRCASCHGPQAGGLIGPNLADAYWIHGDGTPSEIYKVVDKGVNDKGMPNWGAILKPGDLKQVTAFVYSLKGSHPGNPKAPQGQKVN